MRRRVAMLLSSAYGPDVRVQKEAHTLALAGYRVSVIAWDRAGQFPAHAVERTPETLDAALASWPGRVAQPEPVTVTRVGVRAGYRTGLPLARRMPRFWWRALGELRRVRPDIVHANDLDTLPLALLYGRARGIPVVYDAREYYPGMVRDSVGETASCVLDRLDRVLAPRADAVLTVGERLAARYRALGAAVTIVHNSQPLPDAEAIAAAGRALRAAWGVPDGALLVVYVGYLTPDRLLAPVVEAATRLGDVWLVIGGTGPQLDTLQRAAAVCERVRVLGWVPLEQVAAVVAAGDVVYYGLDAANLNSFYFMPNLAFFAFAVGRPLLTTPVGEIAEVVAHERCGIVMEAATAHAAEQGLRELCEWSSRDTLAKRVQVLGRSKFNWVTAGERLLRAYDCLPGVKNCLNY